MMNFLERHFADTYIPENNVDTSFGEFFIRNWEEQMKNLPQTVRFQWIQEIANKLGLISRPFLTNPDYLRGLETLRFKLTPEDERYFVQAIITKCGAAANCIQSAENIWEEKPNYNEDDDDDESDSSDEKEEEEDKRFSNISNTIDIQIPSLEDMLKGNFDLKDMKYQQKLRLEKEALELKQRQRRDEQLDKEYWKKKKQERRKQQELKDKRRSRSDKEEMEDYEFERPFYIDPPPVSLLPEAPDARIDRLLTTMMDDLDCDDNLEHSLAQIDLNEAAFTCFSNLGEVKEKSINEEDMEFLMDPEIEKRLQEYWDKERAIWKEKAKQHKQKKTEEEDEDYDPGEDFEDWFKREQEDFEKDEEEEEQEQEQEREIDDDDYEEEEFEFGIDDFEWEDFRAKQRVSEWGEDKQQRWIQYILEKYMEVGPDEFIVDTKHDVIEFEGSTRFKFKVKRKKGVDMREKIRKFKEALKADPSIIKKELEQELQRHTPQLVEPSLEPYRKGSQTPLILTETEKKSPLPRGFFTKRAYDLDRDKFRYEQLTKVREDLHTDRFGKPQHPFPLPEAEQTQFDDEQEQYLDMWRSYESLNWKTWDNLATAHNFNEQSLTEELLNKLDGKLEELNLKDTLDYHTKLLFEEPEIKPYIDYFKFMRRRLGSDKAWQNLKVSGPIILTDPSQYVDRFLGKIGVIAERPTYATTKIDEMYKEALLVEREDMMNPVFYAYTDPDKYSESFIKKVKKWSYIPDWPLESIPPQFRKYVRYWRQTYDYFGGTLNVKALKEFDKLVKDYSKLDKETIDEYKLKNETGEPQGRLLPITDPIETGFQMTTHAMAMAAFRMLNPSIAGLTAIGLRPFFYLFPIFGLLIRRFYPGAQPLGDDGDDGDDGGQPPGDDGAPPPGDDGRPPGRIMIIRLLTMILNETLRRHNQFASMDAAQRRVAIVNFIANNWDRIRNLNLENLNYENALELANDFLRTVNLPPIISTGEINAEIIGLPNQPVDRQRAQNQNYAVPFYERNLDDVIGRFANQNIESIQDMITRLHLEQDQARRLRNTYSTGQTFTGSVGSSFSFNPQQQLQQLTENEITERFFQNLMRQQQTQQEQDLNQQIINQLQQQQQQNILQIRQNRVNPLENINRPMSFQAIGDRRRRARVSLDRALRQRGLIYTRRVVDRLMMAGSLMITPFRTIYGNTHNYADRIATNVSSLFRSTTRQLHPRNIFRRVAVPIQQARESVLGRFRRSDPIDLANRQLEQQNAGLEADENLDNFVNGALQDVMSNLNLPQGSQMNQQELDALNAFQRQAQQAMEERRLDEAMEQMRLDLPSVPENVQLDLPNLAINLPVVSPDIISQNLGYESDTSQQIENQLIDEMIKEEEKDLLSGREIRNLRSDFVFATEEVKQTDEEVKQLDREEKTGMPALERETDDEDDEMFNWNIPIDEIDDEDEDDYVKRINTLIARRGELGVHLRKLRMRKQNNPEVEREIRRIQLYIKKELDPLLEDLKKRNERRKDLAIMSMRADVMASDDAKQNGFQITDINIPARGQWTGVVNNQESMPAVYASIMNDLDKKDKIKKEDLIGRDNIIDLTNDLPPRITSAIQFLKQEEEEEEDDDIEKQAFDDEKQEEISEKQLRKQDTPGQISPLKKKDRRRKYRKRRRKDLEEDDTENEEESQRKKAKPTKTTSFITEKLVSKKAKKRPLEDDTANVAEPPTSKRKKQAEQTIMTIPVVFGINQANEEQSGFKWSLSNLGEKAKQAREKAKQLYNTKKMELTKKHRKKINKALENKKKVEKKLVINKKLLKKFAGTKRSRAEMEEKIEYLEDKANKIAQNIRKEHRKFEEELEKMIDSYLTKRKKRKKNFDKKKKKDKKKKDDKPPDDKAPGGGTTDLIVRRVLIPEMNIKKLEDKGWIDKIIKSAKRPIDEIKKIDLFWEMIWNYGIVDRLKKSKEPIKRISLPDLPTKSPDYEPPKPPPGSGLIIDLRKNYTYNPMFDISSLRSASNEKYKNAVKKLKTLDKKLLKLKQSQLEDWRPPQEGYVMYVPLKKNLAEIPAHRFLMVSEIIRTVEEDGKRKIAKEWAENKITSYKQKYEGRMTKPEQWGDISMTAEKLSQIVYDNGLKGISGEKYPIQFQVVEQLMLTTLGTASVLEPSNLIPIAYANQVEKFHWWCKKQLQIFSKWGINQLEKTARESGVIMIPNELDIKYKINRYNQMSEFGIYNGEQGTIEELSFGVKSKYLFPEFKMFGSSEVKMLEKQNVAKELLIKKVMG